VKIKFDMNLMQFMNVFSSIAHTDLKDCFIDDNELLTYVVNINDLGKAVGKKGFKVKMIEKAVNRKIKILEFNPELVSFVRNLVYPLQAKNITEEDGIVTIEPEDSRNRGLLIGRAAQNLRNFEKIVKRHFEIKEIKVL